jgi:hypothetical protein
VVDWPVKLLHIVASTFNIGFRSLRNLLSRLLLSFRHVTVWFCALRSYIQELVGQCWQGPVATVNYRPVLSSERAPRNNKPATV